MTLIRVWDLPTRLFHWALPVAVVTLFITGDQGGSWMEWHMRAGYAVAALLLFRVIWGFVGGRWSRFSSFVPSPSQLLDYWRDPTGPSHPVGHNPLGALSVLALLGMLAAQVATGLVSNDDIAYTGPLYAMVSSQISDLATRYHTEIGKVILLALIGLHLAAIAYHRIAKKHNLVTAMVTGDQAVAPPVPQPARDDAIQRLVALAVFAACCLVVLAVVNLGTGHV